MADTTGHTIELPIKSNFREGSTYWNTSCPLMERVKDFLIPLFRTADSGYPTRRLVDVSRGSDRT